jgi:hypothetical protein
VIVHPLVDNIPEGRKSVILTLDQITCTGAPESDTVYIDDYTAMTLNPLYDTVVCEGHPVSYAAIKTGGMAPYLYQWSITSLNDSIITVIPPVGNNTVVLNVTDVCTNVATKSASLIVNPTPLANAGTNVTIPNGTSTTLNGSASGGSGTYSYAWTSIPPGFNATIPNPSTGNLYFTTIFSLVITDVQTGCLSESSTVTVIVEGGPLSANPGADPSHVCLGDTAQLFALPGGGSGLYTYNWTSDPPGFASTLMNPIVTPLVSTAYFLALNDGFNSVNGSTHVSVDPPPAIHLGPADTIVCIYDTVRLDAGNPGSTYFWSTGSTARSITVCSSGIGYEYQTYWVSVTNPNQCTDSAKIHVIFTYGACLGVDDQGVKNRFLLYPNPADGTVRITMDNPGKHVNVEFYSVYGTKMISDRVTVPSGEPLDQSFNISSLPGGIYIVKVIGDHVYGSEKLIVR